MAIVDGAISVFVDRSRLLAGIDRSDGPTKTFTIEQLADAIHKSFCEPRGFRGLAGEIHRRQHVEIAKTIIEAKP